ncbi:PTS lactose/cellobiose transporter subunit IIA [Luteococcus sp. H138]|uniref:PTS lactose/cellobiose transporter subunit IIA n=1 Tax=unclassified Luteococcus TaxID=2639923 RepID=UPI00313B6F18
MSKDPYEIAFQLILAAGNSKSKAYEAIEAAREERFDEARQFIRDSEAEFRAAHDLQFSLLQDEAKKRHVAVNIILVHAEDHVTMALMARENAEEFINVYSAIAELKKTITASTITSKEN